MTGKDLNEKDKAIIALSNNPEINARICRKCLEVRPLTQKKCKCERLK